MTPDGEATAEKGSTDAQVSQAGCWGYEGEWRPIVVTGKVEVLAWESD